MLKILILGLIIIVAAFLLYAIVAVIAYYRYIGGPRVRADKKQQGVSND